MKKLLFLLTLFVLNVVAHAQVNGVDTVTIKSQYAKRTDTITTTTPKYLTTGKITGSWEGGSVAVSALEISGTTAGTVTLEASLDGVTWYSYYSAMDTSYSFTLADVATRQGFRFVLGNFCDKFLRVKIVGSGSPNAIVSAQYMFRAFSK